MIVRKNNKVYVKCFDLSGVNYKVKYLNEDGDVEHIKKFGDDFEFPFRRHILKGGPKDGKRVFARRDEYWYDVESGDGNKLYCYSSRDFQNEKSFVFTFDQTIDYSD